MFNKHPEAFQDIMPSDTANIITVTLISTRSASGSRGIEQTSSVFRK